jgi:branched-chain amino acid transport system ATP-binding protein
MSSGGFVAATETRTPLLEVDAISRRFGGLKAVDEVSLAVGAGEIVALIGPNGAGKTTLFNLLTGQLRPTSGDVRLRGRSITRLRPHRRARLGLGRTFQIVHPLRTLTVLENVMISAFSKYRRRTAAERRARQVLDDVELGHRAGTVSSSLNLAERKRLEMARALGGEPELLLLDEVLAGLNPVESERAVEIIRRLNRGGITVLLIEHDLKVVRAIAHRVVVLDHGALIAEGAPEAVLQDPRVVEAYLGAKRSS